MSKPQGIEDLKNNIERKVYTVEQTKNYIKNQMRNLVLKGDKYKSALIFIEGEAGIGKTSIQKQILKEMESEILSMKSVAHPECLEHFKTHKGQLIVKNYAANDAQDIGGMPLEPKVDEKTGIAVQLYSNPLPQFGYGIYFQDEANRVTDPQLKTMQLSLWVDRGVNGNYLGKGYLQVLAGNTFNDSAYKTSKGDKAHTERYVIIHMKPTFSEVMAYLEPLYKNHPMIGFLKENKEFINLFNPNKTGFSPRSLDFFMNETDLIIQDLDNQENLALVNMIVDAYFGDQGQEFLKYLKNEEDVNFSKILKNPELANKIKKHDTALMNRVLIQMQEHLKNAGKENKITKHDVSIVRLVLETFTKEHLSLFVEWISTCKVKYSVNMVQILKDLDPNLFKDFFTGLEQTFATSARST